MGRIYRFSRFWFRYWLECRARDIANMLPRSLVFWCMIRAAAYAIKGMYKGTNVEALRFMDVLRYWGAEK